METMCDCPISGCKQLAKIDEHGNQFCRDLRCQAMMEHREAANVEVAPDRVVEAVRADLLRRSIHGFNKYGAGLDTNPAPLVGQLQHAYEEALDLCNYLKWTIMRLEGNGELAPDQTRGTGLGGV